MANLPTNKEEQEQFARDIVADFEKICSADSPKEEATKYIARANKYIGLKETELSEHPILTAELGNLKKLLSAAQERLNKISDKDFAKVKTIGNLMMVRSETLTSGILKALPEGEITPEKIQQSIKSYDRFYNLAVSECGKEPIDTMIEIVAINRARGLITAPAKVAAQASVKTSHLSDEIKRAAEQAVESSKNGNLSPLRPGAVLSKGKELEVA